MPVHKLLPPCFSNLFNVNKQVHNYNTRNADQYRPHACKTNIKQFTILFSGPKLWNSLPDTVRKAETLGSFRNRMIKYLLKWQINVTDVRLIRSHNYLNLIPQGEVPCISRNGFRTTPCHWHNHLKRKL